MFALGLPQGSQQPQGLGLQDAGLTLHVLQRGHSGGGRSQAQAGFPGVVAHVVHAPRGRRRRQGKRDLTGVVGLQEGPSFPQGPGILLRPSPSAWLSAVWPGIQADLRAAGAGFILWSCGTGFYSGSSSEP